MISQSTLESYLWGAPTLLRGYIDAGDYKQFIFPLLFYKRLCDVYDEELAAALAASGGDRAYAEMPEQHRFQIPPKAPLGRVRIQATNVAKAIQDALRAIEKANHDTLLAFSAMPSGPTRTASLTKHSATQSSISAA